MIDTATPCGIPPIHRHKTGGENLLWVLTHPDLRKVEWIKIAMKFLATAIADF